MTLMLPTTEHRSWWVRLFGWGLHWTDHRAHPPVYSERTGRRRALHVGPWCFRLLAP